MSQDDLFLRFVWTTLQLMKSPFGSAERAEWIRILDDIKMKMATTGMVTTSDDFNEIGW